MRAMKLLSLGCLSAALACYGFNDHEVTEIQKIVHSYIVSNPKVLVEASEALKAQQQSEVNQKAASAIDSHRDELFFKASDPAIGAEKPAVRVVEFFDYQCGHCKHMHPVLTKLASSRHDVRVIYKELPIFKGASLTAAKIALAAHQQGKFAAVHDALFLVKPPLSEEALLAAVHKNVPDLNMDKLSVDMKSKELMQMVDANMALARSLLEESVGYVFTPVLVLMNEKTHKTQFVPGGVDFERLNQMINQML